MNSESLIFTNGHSFNKIISVNRNYYALNTFEVKKWMVG
ncbi:cobalamin biosynthesis protein P47K [Bacillus cereus]|nr:cobalamin biosynthesis protein P47K [Bacillus cereus]PED91707.1 cobalamin biosynthesis protein P47K [Bacillus cereus]PEQ42410.1 cobalamin biosynthesis protein P47K [Bacillus cereus]PER71689.1 cobalamin biosynthesis protein P47K [Bacillus cereus]PEW54949.1 cobalamin biosynthesis protein P47K [Bacillus cereus]PEY17556.1 cobalamin biosynthesis protein P47K [Bacillus cereus]